MTPRESGICSMKACGEIYILGRGFSVNLRFLESVMKAESEALVTKSNGTNGLLTCCICPSSIFGPGDSLLVPSLFDAARKGKSKFIIGDGNNVYDLTYVENVVHAHICVDRALVSKGPISEKATGEAYFITNMELMKFWEFMLVVVKGLGYECKTEKTNQYPSLQRHTFVKWWTQFDSSKADPEQVKVWFQSHPEFLKAANQETSVFLNQKSHLAAFLAGSKSKEVLAKNLKEVLQMLQQEEEGSSSKKEETSSAEEEEEDPFYQNEDDCFGICLD
eukprot:XP_006593209.1 uncharacterized protein LOC100797101 [Glycine max]